MTKILQYIQIETPQKQHSTILLCSGEQFRLDASNTQHPAQFSVQDYMQKKHRPLWNWAHLVFLQIYNNLSYTEVTARKW